MLLCVGLLGLKGLGRDCLAPQIAIGLQLFLHVFLVVDHVLVLRKVTVGLRQKGSVIRLIILLFRYLAEKEPPLVDLPLERLLLHLELLLLGREKPRAVAAGGSGQGGVRWCGNYSRTITILFFSFPYSVWSPSSSGAPPLGPAAQRSLRQQLEGRQLVVAGWAGPGHRRHCRPRTWSAVARVPE